MAVLFNASNHELGLGLSEELLSHARLVGKLGEVNDEVPANDTDEDGENTLKDEDSAPSTKTGAERDRSGGFSLSGTAVDTKPWGGLVTVTLKKGEEVSKDTREGRRKHANEEEDSVALLELESLVPNREDQCRSFEEQKNIIRKDDTTGNS